MKNADDATYQQYRQDIINVLTDDSVKSMSLSQRISMVSQMTERTLDSVLNNSFGIEAKTNSELSIPNPDIARK